MTIDVWTLRPRGTGIAAAAAALLLASEVALAGSPIELSSVAGGAGGFVINGIDPGDESGESVSGAGDVNGDGLDDLIVGARFADPGGDSAAGETYVVFGKTSTTAVDLATLAASGGGFVINGIDANDESGGSVACAGDVNGDGRDDIIIGARLADPGGDSAAGETYVVFGKTSTTAVELATIAAGGGGGFVINGIDPNDESGESVSGAGDVNGDGLDDVIVGARLADPGGDNAAGESYVVFGKTSTTAIDLATIAAGGGGGFVINGIDPQDASGASVSGAGDVNGDGMADLIIGATGGDPGGDSSAGEAYVVFGTTSTTAVDLASVVAGAGGFVMNGIVAGDGAGATLSSAGDVNGDGLGDVLVGAPGAFLGFDAPVGQSYVVFGKTSTAAVELSAVVADRGGFALNGSVPTDSAGAGLSGAGDVNGDGLADLIVGAPGVDPNGDTSAGQTYVVYGKTDTATVFLWNIPGGDGGFALNGIDSTDRSGTSVSRAGDVNGDGVADFVIGADGGDPGGDAAAGETYVVFAPTPSCSALATVPAYLATGTSGAFTGVPQSFNETRGVDVTVASVMNQSLSTMSLSGLFIETPSATVGARIYHSASASLIASESTTISSGPNQIVTIPVSTTLIAGEDYRLCFFVDADGFGSEGTMFDPAPTGASGFPYTELSGRLEINQAYSIATDSFPTNANSFVPVITITSTPVCPADFDGTGDVGFGDLTVLLIHWGPCPPHCPWDLDGSGDVGFGDLTALLLGWG